MDGGREQGGWCGGAARGLPFVCRHDAELPGAGGVAPAVDVAPEAGTLAFGDGALAVYAAAAAAVGANVLASADVHAARLVVAAEASSPAHL